MMSGPSRRRPGPVPDLPPLMSALACVDEPMQVARGRAMAGVDAGLVCWRETARTLQAAMVLAPDVALVRAMAALPACMVGMQNAIGSLGPSELQLLLGRDGVLWLNGARAGGFRVAAATCDPAVVPDWLVVGCDVTLRSANGTEGGEMPGQTSLAGEGCPLTASDLLGAWGRHSLYWLSCLDNRLGRSVLMREWQGLCMERGDGGCPGLDGDFARTALQGEAATAEPLSAIPET
ncbi:MAG: hypothetical protein KDG54_13380 [Geminicoccaceae bacterium]|nr:hypothetical protein [Geminicoccaceae bacterium]